jgi:hypothetical protein
MTASIGSATAPRLTRSTALQTRLANARAAFTTRRIDFAEAAVLKRRGVAPAAGDLVLAEVISVGQHPRLENHAGRRGQLYPGDEIVVAYGNRYAPDQFEAFVPDQLGACHLAAGGGVAADVRVRHARMRPATEIRPIGLIARRCGTVMNLADFAVKPAAGLANLPPVIAVVGSSMNAGKTTSAAGIIHGLTRAGLRVGAAKLTGTGSGGDLWTMRDAGAVTALDFTDAGHASTYLLDLATLEAITTSLLAQMTRPQHDMIVVEIADGLLQRETAMLLEAAQRRGWFQSVMFAAGDAMSACHGTALLERMGLPATAITGLISTSPLASREAETVTGLPVVPLQLLRDPVQVPKLLLAERLSRPVAASAGHHQRESVAAFAGHRHWESEAA